MLLIRFVRSLVEATVCKSLPSRSDTPACSAPGTVSVADATMALSTCCRSGSASSDRATSRKASATSTSPLGPDSDGLWCSCGMYVLCSLAEVVEPKRLGSSTGAGAEPTFTANQAMIRAVHHHRRHAPNSLHLNLNQFGGDDRSCEKPLPATGFDDNQTWS